ncbi:hypothetical protein [Corynebacterium sp. J010B-136]|uniref:hypothetical protein n=1 Tax=Corynebacterium sp. J010B-136 TaxID=2099401 RepID=UPI000CFA1AC6|nr:hypothetical protein [Corynebacterium sp. J010B-136]PQM75090.1 hypothetical protein C5Y44_05375 [Corynebacterium sp. J010B-136]
MKRTLALFAASTALALGACGAPAEDEAPATSTVTQEVTADETTAAPSASESNSDNSGGESEAAEDSASAGDSTPAEEDGDTPSEEPEQPDPSEQSPEDFQALMAEEMRNNGQIGDTFTIDGQPTELCIHGDGFGLNVVTAGANTSCDFASNLLEATSQDLNPTGQNIRDIMPQSVEVSSPVTNQSYMMNCSTDARNLITCTGGDNAVVFMY